jgi:hypothetical protein
VLRTYWERRRDYHALRDGGTYPDLHWIELRHRSEATTFLDNARRAG